MTANRPKDLPPGSFVTLAEALTWLAFGNVKNRVELNRELAGNAFGIGLDRAKIRLATAVSKLIDAVEAGKIHLRGVRECDGQTTAPGTPDAHIHYSDVEGFRQYDVTVDGLRFGEGLAWVPDQHCDWPHAPPKSRFFFSKVKVRQADLRKALMPGRAASAGIPRASAPPVTDTDLKRWWKRLTPQERKSPEKELRRLCDQAFPGKKVTRIRLRGLMGPRGLGRPAKSP